MVRKHISRDFTNHVRTVQHIGDDDEYIRFEVFSFDPKYTRIYLPEKGTLTGENATKTSWKSWSCYRSADKINPMEFTVNYSVLEAGDYQFDIVYEQKSNMYSDSKDSVYNTGKDLLGWYDIYEASSKSEHTATILKANTTVTKTVKEKQTVTDSKTKKKTTKVVTTKKEVTNPAVQKALDKVNKNVISKASSAVNIKFDGENNIIKRKTLYNHLNAGKYKLEFAVPHNCYCLGVIVRKIRRYWGTNTDEAGTNLQFTKSSLTISEMAKPSELEVTVGYDDAFECDESPTGLYMDYMNECNLYVQNNEGNIVQIFGGYLTSILPDSDRTELSIHCADRLKDGEAKYILDKLELQHGDSDESNYDTTNTKSFDTYGQLLKYLCDICEITLNSNIQGNYVEGEVYTEGKSITFGKKKDVKKVPVTNAKVTINKNSITMRNNPSGKKKQVWTLYSAKEGKTPTNISNYNYFHVTYGLGNPRTEHKSKETSTVDIASSTAGSQKFGKCGRSQDGKYLMAIGQRSVGRGKTTYPYTQIYRTVFENKCPHCGGKLVWDSGRSDTNCVHCSSYKRSKREWGNISETEITCSSCCADFCAVTGWDKDGKYSKKLKKVGSSVKSSKSEQNKLHNGNMVAVVKGGKTSISSKDIFKAIKNSTKGFKHSTGTGTTASYLEKHGVGDCWAWSDKISKELKRYKVNHKIVQYVSSGSNQHRSVLYQNSKGDYVDFPYREYKFPQGTYNTSGSKKGKAVYKYKSGGRINQAVTSGSTSKTQTTEVTTTKGYDKDKPIQGYFDICFSTSPKAGAKKYHIYLNFTQTAKSAYAQSGLKPVWVNNSIKTITFTGFVSKIRDYMGNVQVYLQHIKFIAPVIATKTKEDSTDWYTSDKSTNDNSSCKMLLYKLSFDNLMGTEPQDLQACGKSVNDLMSSVIKDTGFIVDMEYSTHRCNDKINFKVNDNTEPVFHAREGDDNNILEWGNISYSPVNSLYNMSMCVFLNTKTNKYNYVDTRVAESIMSYQEQCTLETVNEATGEKEAYWKARHSDKFNPEQTYTFTITVKGYPDIKLMDLVEVTANAKKLNTLKEVESISVKYDYTDKPVIQTEIGLGELAPDIQVTKTIRQLRDNAKKSTTSFFGTATPITDEEIYEWDN